MAYVIFQYICTVGNNDQSMYSTIQNECYKRSGNVKLLYFKYKIKTKRKNRNI